MSENELHERYIRLAFQYESAMDALLTRIGRYRSGRRRKREIL